MAGPIEDAVKAAVAVHPLGFSVLAAGGLLAARLYLATQVHPGIVLPDQLAVREGPDPAARSTLAILASAASVVDENSTPVLVVK